ncbi:MAG: sialidase family protein [Treponemataceae bacterium]
MKILSLETLPKEKDRKASRHASTILPLADGSVLAAYFAGTYEAESDVDIYLTKRGVDGYWSAPFRVSREEGVAHWNPVLSLRSDGDIVLFYKVGFEIVSWKTMVRVSRDGGRDWDKPRELVPGDSGGRGPVRNKVIVLHDGNWLAGGSLEQETRWSAFADRSEDEGRTWKRSADIAIDASDGAFIDNGNAAPKTSIAVSEQSFRGRGVIQPSLWEDSPSGVHMLLRSTEGFAYRSDSPDGGKTWSDPYRTDIPNNNSALDLVRLRDGRLVLAHNPVAGNWGDRTPLVLSVSNDYGRTWERGIVLEDGPGEFSYPAIVKGPDTLFVSWTRNRTEIAFARIE